MRRPAKIFKLWKDLEKIPYQPRDANRDTRLKKNISKGLDKLRRRDNEQLTEDSPAGQNFLEVRDQTSVFMRNYCRSLKPIGEKRLLKQAKKLTAIVMTLSLRELDNEAGLGSLESLEGGDVNLLDAQLEQGDEPEVEDDGLEEIPGENRPPERPQTLPPPLPPRHLQQDGSTLGGDRTVPKPPPRPQVPPPQVPGLSWVRVDARLQQLVRLHNRLRTFPPTQALLTRAFNDALTARNGQGATPEGANAALERFETALHEAKVRFDNEHTLQQERLTHNRARQDKIKTLTLAGRQFFQVGMSQVLAKQKLAPGKTFKAFQTALAAAEDEPTEENLHALEQAAHRYLQHFIKDLSVKEQNSRETKLKKQVCEQALQMVPLQRCQSMLNDLGPPEHWGLLEESQAAALYAKALFETGDQDLAPKGGGSANQYWWVEKSLGATTKSKFIFKPSDAEGEAAGFPRGGSAPREVLSKAIGDKLQGITGLDFRFPETHLVAIEKNKLGSYNDPDETVSSTVGSLQHFSKSNGPLDDKIQGPTEETLAQLRTIPPEECQKMAVLDLLMLNCDRHMGNFLCQEIKNENGEVVETRLVPIDHGLSLPSKDGLRQRRDSFAPPKAALTMLPGSEQPFTPEMLAKIKAIDPDEIVQAARDAQHLLEQQHPEVAERAAIQEENYEMLRCSCQFLKAAAAAGLTPAEIYDALAQNQDDIFFAEETERDASQARAIQAARDRSAERQRVRSQVPTTRESMPLLNDLSDRLGWPVDSTLERTNADPGYLQLMKYPGLYDIQQRGIPNPLMVQEVADLREQLRAANQPLPEIPEGALLPQERDLLRGACDRLSRQRYQDFIGNAEGMPTDGRVYFLALEESGGEQALQQRTGEDLTTKTPREKLELFATDALTRWTEDGTLAQMQQAFPGERYPNNILPRYKLLTRWLEYVELGGNDAYKALGLDPSVDNLHGRCGTLRTALSLKNALDAQANVPPPPQDLPPPPPVQEVDDALRDLVLKVSELPPEHQNGLKPRIKKAREFRLKGKLRESLELILEVKEDLSESKQ